MQTEYNMICALTEEELDKLKVDDMLYIHYGEGKTVALIVSGKSDKINA